MGKAAIGVGAVLIVVGGGLLGFALTRKDEVVESPTASPQVLAAIDAFDGALKTNLDTVDRRAKAIALKTPTRSVIGADTATAMNMISEGKELDFMPGSTETIEIVQIENGKPVSMIILPPTAPRLAGPATGTRTTLDGDSLAIARNVPVAPYYPDAAKQRNVTDSYVTVTQKLDLAKPLADLAAAGLAGKLEIGAAAREIGTIPAGAKIDTKPLAAISDAKLSYALPLPVTTGGKPIALVGAGAAAALLGLLLVIIGMMAKKQAPTMAFEAATSSAVASAPTAQAPVARNAETKFSGTHPVAAGTPSPIEPGSSNASINPQNLGPGAMIGRWEVIRRLGSGGMADVYLAHSKGEAGFEKLVAIKVMHAHLARNERAVAHFLDEARLAARIHHPNVVAIQDLGKIGNDYVIVMEYVEGVDLERLLVSARNGQRSIPVDIGLGLLCRICDGLNAAHTATGPDGTALAIIHRDVKSANVLVSRQGSVKVVDFGIAKAATQSHLTIQGETKGTPSMMAPEQRVGEQVDVRADVYSVAAVGYEILTGAGVNLDLAALAHLGVENWPHLPLPSSMRTNLPVELDEILLRAMSFERDKRPADCSVFGSTFEALMKQHGMSATDKDLARWVDGELRALVPAFEGASTGISRPAGVS